MVLDPHLYYLGEAIQGTDPGVRVYITEEILELYQNQFKPYNGLFGFDNSLSNDFFFEGTLFRRPLRTTNQA